MRLEVERQSIVDREKESPTGGTPKVNRGGECERVSAKFGMDAVTNGLTQ